MAVDEISCAVAGTIRPVASRWGLTHPFSAVPRPSCGRGKTAHAVAMTTVYPRFSTDSAVPKVSTISGIVCTGILVTK